MSAYAVSLVLLIGIFAGFALAWLVRGRDLARLRDELASRTAATDSLARDLQDEKMARAALAAGQAAEDRAHEKELAALAALRGDVETTLKALAAEALQTSNQAFLSLAGEVFDKHRQAAATLLGEKEKAIEGMLAPISATLEEYRKGLSEIEKAREAAYGGLRTQLIDVSRETRQLATALRAAPQTRGRWGELQLQNVIELAGLSSHVDFVPQQTIEGRDGRLRPDVVIRVPPDRRIVVDAKTPLVAYLDAVEANDDALREEHLRRHARQLRTHMKQLSDKKYWEALLPLTPDYVVMFIPGENFYSAAIERDRELFEDAIAARVLVVTPTTMIALAKTIANGWDQQRLAVEARQVAELGRELYKRLAAMGGHIVQLGASLGRVVEHYNGFVGSIENSVMPQARRFNELAIGRTLEALPELAAIETDARQVRPDRDLTLIPAEMVPPAAAAE
ncbi:MAG TPA: DNA recombination protein RmuC [Stellaceae bacterium]|nr:DNA recombination protein RmuC [Stellaceae bacterium]